MKDLQDTKESYESQIPLTNDHDAKLLEELLTEDEIPKWAYWERVKEDTARCSNHIEAFHNGLNRNARHEQRLEKSINSVIVNMINRNNDFVDNQLASVDRYIKEIVEKQNTNSIYHHWTDCDDDCKAKLHFM